MMSIEKTHIPSGKEIDQYIGGGFEASQVSLVTARPGMGMTTWLLESAFHISQHNQNILYITLQSSIPDTIEYIVRIIGTPKLKHIPAHSFEIAEAFDINMEKLEKLILSNMEEHQTKVVFVDALHYIFTENGEQLMSLSTSFMDTNKIMAQFGAFAKKHGITFIIGALLPPMKKSRLNKRPLHSDVHSMINTKNIPLVIGLYRDEVYDPETDAENELEVHLLTSEDRHDVPFYVEPFEKNKREKDQSL